MSVKKLAIHIVGAHETNYPWGFENKLIPALKAMGHQVIATDFRKVGASLAEKLKQPANLILVCNGAGIPPQLISALPVPKALWWAELLGSLRANDPESETRRRLLAQNIRAYDFVFIHDEAGVDVARQMGADNVHFLSTAAVVPSIHQKLELQKSIDVGFVGHITPRRQRILDQISNQRQVEVKDIWDPAELNRFFNACRIVLNIHLSDLPNTETRLCEAMGAGSFLLSEELSSPRLFTDKKHLGIWPSNDTDNLLRQIDDYLSHEEEREIIAAQGCAYVHSEHTIQRRLEELIHTIGLDSHRTWSGFSLGVPHNQKGEITCSLDAYYQDVASRIVRFNNKTDSYPNQKTGKLRIFAAYAHVNWEDHNFKPALEAFGEVVHFSWNFNAQYHSEWHASGKRIMNENMLNTIKMHHAQKPFDVFFGYLSGRTVFPETIREINRMGIKTLNISLDDRLKFEGMQEPSGYSGQIDIAPEFSLCWTTTHEAVQKYQTAGARAIYLPPGANPDIFRPLSLQRDIDLSFIGQKYGQRPRLIEFLHQKRLSVQTYGKGWESGEIDLEEMIRLYSRSRITLGFGTVGETEDVFCIKGRDFEAPMSGAFYLTQYHQELLPFFQMDKEIVCYHDWVDLVDKANYYLAHPKQTEAIRKAARQRSLAEHTWKRRFEKVFRQMGVIDKTIVYSG